MPIGAWVIATLVLAGALMISAAWLWMRHHVDLDKGRYEMRNREVTPARMRRLWVIDDPERNKD